MNHGTHLCYSKGCRLPDCREAHRVYEKERKRIRARPDSDWHTKGMRKIPAGPVVTYVRNLRRRGVPLLELSRVTGVSQKTMSLLGVGKAKKTYQYIDDRIRAVEFVSAHLARQHLHWLHDHGIDTKTMSREAGLEHYMVSRIYSGRRTLITPKDEDLLLALGLYRFGKRPSDKR